MVAIDWLQAWLTRALARGFAYMHDGGGVLKLYFGSGPSRCMLVLGDVGRASTFLPQLSVIAAMLGPPAFLCLSLLNVTYILLYFHIRSCVFRDLTTL